MRRWWRVVALTLTLGGGSRCSCEPPCSNHEGGAHSTVHLEKGCGGYACAITCDDGWADCDSTIDNGCETSMSDVPPNTTLDTNGIVESGGCGETSEPFGKIGTCDINCKPGFFDCDNDKTNGCESASRVGCYYDAKVPVSDAGEPTTAHRIATLSSEPRGLAQCGVVEVFLDGTQLYVINSSSLSIDHVSTSPSFPIDGLACDGTYAYWATSWNADAAAPNGALYRARITGSTAEPLESAFDPRSGIDVRDAGVFVMTTSGLAVWLGDAGLMPWMPAATTSTYKAFTLTSTDDWSLESASIIRRSSDAGSASWIDDAGTPTALVNVNGEPIVVRHALFDDAGNATGDDLAFVRDDAGAATLKSFTVVQPIVATVSATKTIIASDDAIYLIEPPTATALYTTPDHIIDVAVDGTWVVWTTRGQATSAPGVWRGKIP